MRQHLFRALFWIAAAVLTLSLIGCAPEVRLSERQGSYVASVLSHVHGLDADALTFPGPRGPVTVYLRNADDPGLRCHEQRHAAQIREMGAAEFTREYIRQIAAYGYFGAPLEADARAAQSACE